MLCVPIFCIFLYYSYLAVVAALASEADFVFIPEDPAETNWPDNLCDKILQVVEYAFFLKFNCWWWSFFFV